MKNFDILEFIIEHLVFFIIIIFVLFIAMIIFLSCFPDYQSYMNTKLEDLKLSHLFLIAILHAILSKPGSTNK